MAFPADSPLTVTAAVTAAVSIGLASLVWWRRLARLERLRRQVSGIRTLGHAVLQTAEPAALATLIQEKLRELLGPLKVVVRLNDAGESSPPAAGLSELHGPNSSIPGLRFPMKAQGQSFGCLQIIAEPGVSFPGDVNDALAGLAAHVAIGMEIQGQKRLKEQIARSEQLAATGLLLASIARDLRPPLLDLAREARERDLPAMAAEADQALELVERLAAYGRRERAHATLFDFNEAVRHLCGFRSRAWKLLQIEPHLEFAAEALTVRAARGLVEQAVLGLIVLAEQSIGDSGGPRRVDVTTEECGGNASFTISFPSATPASPAAIEGAAAARSLIESCGGALTEDRRGSSAQFEVSLKISADPAAAPSPAPARIPIRRLTLLLVHPDPRALRSLMHSLAEREHRVVPVDTAGLALEMASRFRFDAIFAAPALNEMDWRTFASRASQYAPVVGWLLTGAHSAPSAAPALRVGAEDVELDAALSHVEGTS